MQYLQSSEMYTIPSPSLESSSTPTSLNVFDSFNTYDPAVCVLASSGTTGRIRLSICDEWYSFSFKMVDLLRVFFSQYLHLNEYAATRWHINEKYSQFLAFLDGVQCTNRWHYGPSKYREQVNTCERISFIMEVLQLKQC